MEKNFNPEQYSRYSASKKFGLFVDDVTNILRLTDFSDHQELTVYSDSSSSIVPEMYLLAKSANIPDITLSLTEAINSATSLDYQEAARTAKDIEKTACLYRDSAKDIHAEEYAFRLIIEAGAKLIFSTESTLTEDESRFIFKKMVEGLDRVMRGPLENDAQMIAALIIDNIKERFDRERVYLLEMNAAAGLLNQDDESIDEHQEKYLTAIRRSYELFQKSGLHYTRAKADLFPELLAESVSDTTSAGQMRRGMLLEDEIYLYDVYKNHSTPAQDMLAIFGYRYDYMNGYQKTDKQATDPIDAALKTDEILEKYVLYMSEAERRDSASRVHATIKQTPEIGSGSANAIAMSEIAYSLVSDSRSNLSLDERVFVMTTVTNALTNTYSDIAAEGFEQKCAEYLDQSLFHFETHTQTLSAQEASELAVSLRLAIGALYDCEVIKDKDVDGLLKRVESGYERQVPTDNETDE